MTVKIIMMSGREHIVTNVEAEDFRQFANRIGTLSALGGYLVFNDIAFKLSEIESITAV